MRGNTISEKLGDEGLQPVLLPPPQAQQGEQIVGEWVVAVNRKGSMEKGNV
jgi:hypothetical protein